MVIMGYLKVTESSPFSHLPLTQYVFRQLVILAHDTIIAYFILFVNTFPLVCHFISLDLFSKDQQPFCIIQVIDQSLSAAMGNLSSFKKWLRIFYWKIKSLLLLKKDLIHFLTTGDTFPF